MSVTWEVQEGTCSIHLNKPERVPGTLQEAREQAHELLDTCQRECTACSQVGADHITRIGLHTSAQASAAHTGIPVQACSCVENAAHDAVMGAVNPRIAHCSASTCQVARRSVDKSMDTAERVAQTSLWGRVTSLFNWSRSA